MKKRGAPPVKEKVENLKRIIEKEVLTKITQLEDSMRETRYRMAKEGEQSSELRALSLSMQTRIGDIEDWKKDIKDALKKSSMSLTAKDTSTLSQDVARLAGRLQTHIEKVESLYDRILRIERKYLFPDAYKVMDLDAKIIENSIENVEDKQGELKKGMKALEDEDKKLHSEIKAIGTVLAGLQIKFCNE